MKKYLSCKLLLQNVFFYIIMKIKIMKILKLNNFCKTCESLQTLGDIRNNVFKRIIPLGDTCIGLGREQDRGKKRVGVKKEEKRVGGREDE